MVAVFGDEAMPLQCRHFLLVGLAGFGGSPQKLLLDLNSIVPGELAVFTAVATEACDIVVDIGPDVLGGTGTLEACSGSTGSLMSMISLL